MAHAAGQERPDVAARRKAWLVVQPDLEPTHLIFTDETEASTKMGGLRDRALREQQCRAAIPAWTLEKDNLRPSPAAGGMTAPMILDWQMKRAAFHALVEQVLVPTLPCGDNFITNNLPPTRATRYAAPSKPQEQAHATCRPTRSTSIQSRTLSPN